MKTSIETQDPSVIAQLQPIIDLVAGFQGHINHNYTHGSQFCNLDVTYKQLLMEKINELLEAKNFVIGCGAGHIWIANVTGCRINWHQGVKVGDVAKVESWEPVAINGIHDRVLLITD